MPTPTLTYDCEANAVDIRFSSNAMSETVEISESVYVNVDANGQPIGFEVLARSSGRAGVAGHRRAA